MTTQSASHKPVKQLKEYPPVLFGVDVAELLDEWNRESIDIKFGRIEHDLMVQKWLDCFMPTRALEKAGVYGLFKKYVEGRKLSDNSSTYYRGIEFQCLAVGDVIDYSEKLTSWAASIKEVESWCDDAVSRAVLLKITGKHIKGLDVAYPGEDCVIFGGCKLLVTRMEKCERYTLYEVAQHEVLIDKYWKAFASLDTLRKHLLVDVVDVVRGCFVRELLD